MDTLATLDDLDADQFATRLGAGQARFDADNGDSLDLTRVLTTRTLILHGPAVWTIGGRRITQDLDWDTQGGATPQDAWEVLEGFLTDHDLDAHLRAQQVRAAIDREDALVRELRTTRAHTTRLMRALERDGWAQADIARLTGRTRAAISARLR